MIDGVVLYFAPDGKTGHVWCVLNEVPLCVVYREDFPELWDKLEIGTRVQLCVRPYENAMRAHKMRLFSLEPVGCF